MTDNQTIAEQCAAAYDPYEAATAACAYKSTPSPQGVHFPRPQHPAVCGHL